MKHLTDYVSNAKEIFCLT